mgnify:FL=1
MTNAASTPTKRAFQFVLLLGVVSLFADMTYEGARSIAGPYLAVLGASGKVVGVVSGFGELLGYGLRFVSGWISDRTRQYWAITIAGYFINLLAVPALALAGRWESAAALLIAERVGKAIRNPPRDAMLSHAASGLGAGWAFGLHEALDQIGAVTGPLLVAAVLHFRGGYQESFAMLLIPALLALAVLLTARFLYPRPRDLEQTVSKVGGEGMPRVFWVYLAAAGLVAAGYVDFPLIAFHLKRQVIASETFIPFLYSVAMAVDAISALIFGRLFDRKGIKVMAWVAALGSLFAPLVFLGGSGMALLGMAIWGVGMGAQESILRAAVAGMVSPDRRGSAFGLFNAGFGVAWFAGSAAMGVLYDHSILLLVTCSIGLQMAAVPVFLASHSRVRA